MISKWRLLFAGYTMRWEKLALSFRSVLIKLNERVLRALKSLEYLKQGRALVAPPINSYYVNIFAAEAAT